MLAWAALWSRSHITSTGCDEISNKSMEQVYSFKSLYEAMHKCKRNVMWKDSVGGYIKNGLVNCYKLRQQLLNGTYKIDKYTVFTIHEPKTREIVATRMKDRVFQRSFCDNYLTKRITRAFIYDNGACQTGKGTDFAMNRLNRHLQRHFREYGLDGYVLKIDLKDFFGSTSHDVAKSVVKDYITDGWALTHIDRIVESFNQGEDPAVGMGLGSQITQLVQLAVLNRLDHIIKERLHIRHYLRYMDDLILIHESKKYLAHCLIEIKAHITSLGLRINERKTKVFPLKQKIKFLGFNFFLTKTGKVIRTVDRKNIARRKRKLRRMVSLAKKAVISRQDVDRSFESWKAHAKRGNSYKLLLSMDKFYEELWMEANKNV